MSSNTPVSDEMIKNDQQQLQQQQQQSQPQQITCDYGNVVYTDYDYASGTVPMMQQQQQPQQASPSSSYYIYHTPAAVSGVATPDPYYQCVPAYMPQSYVSYEQHNQMAYLSQAQVPQQQAQSVLASPQNQSGMLSALNQSSYQTPPQSTQFGLATATPDTTIDNSSPNQMPTAGPNAYPYLMPYPTPSYHPYGSPSASYMMYSPQSPPQVAAHQQQQQQQPPAAYHTPQTPPSNNNMDNRKSHRSYRYSNNRYNNRRQNYHGETTPKKCNLNETMKSPLSCITNEESGLVNYQYVSSPNPVPMAMGMYSPGPSVQTAGMYSSPESYCCSPLDSSYYQQQQTPQAAAAAAAISPYGGYSINPFYPNQTDFDMSTHCLPTPSEYADSIAQEHEQEYGVGKEDDDETGGEQLACYTCRGRRMCFCYFLKVRYYKFPSFLDLVDHQYKKWRSNIVKTRKAAANTATTAQ